MWSKHTLYSFAGGNDGVDPYGGVVLDAAGSLYGVTSLGALGYGTVYELSQSNGSWTETILHAFQYSDGSNPIGSLIADAARNLYGATAGGGSAHQGTMFELSQPGNWTFQTLYNFPSYSTGAQPAGGLVFDTAGNLYGTTLNGGANNGGTVFKLAPSNGNWMRTDLHDFSVSDGTTPNGSLIFDSHGNLYGTAQVGGAPSDSCYSGCGTVWEITP